MQAVILAAGMGSRLGKYTANNTKCMLSVNGKTLIERALDALDSAAVTKCVIVVGYQKDNLMNFVGPRYKNIDITYIANDVYNKTNNIYSLYLAREYLLQDDTLLLESDLIFEDRIIADLIQNPEPTLAVVAPYESWMDGTVVQITEDNIITNFIPKKSFNYHEKESYYKTVNIYKFSRDFLRTSYVPFLEAYSQAMGNNEYYEQVLRVITTLDKNELKALVLRDQKWYEIDDVQDKDIAETIFSNTADETLKLISRRYGGYWRFPKLLDFCYLVNPCFPTEQMRNEMKAYFDELLTEYPSGLNVQNLLAGKLFDVDEANILTGNGAAELIRAAAPLIKGTVGVIYPTFNEYPESLGDNAVIVPLYPPNAPKNMAYTADDLIEWSKQCDTMILINPDNPSGNYIPCADLLRLLEILKQQNKALLLDESFIDFSDAEENGSLLSQNVLEQYPKLIIVKSLSKSYGIPGIRLGVLACGDTALIKSIRKNMPIWNINSFAEYFLQIIGKYQKDYRKACQSIVQERRRFKAELDQTGLFEVYPSQANYFLCRCSGNFTAGELAKYLLEQHAIFIKDLAGKNGIPGEEWLRLAIRDQADNEVLIERLYQFKKYVCENKLVSPRNI
ncbi:aminotransferase [Spirochaetia bacterium]|nr:aminotransferase [Spirochaetia bacterium]